MDGELIQVGEVLVVNSALCWVGALLAESAGPMWRRPSGRTPDVEVVIEATSGPFDTRGWEPLTRGAYRRDGHCVLENACGAGFDLRVGPSDDGIRMDARWRPPGRERAAAWALRSRFHLLTRAVLVQYPAMWRAGLRGRVPLHAAAVALGDSVPLLVGPGGVGRSTVLQSCGGSPCSDNLVVGDPERVYGLVEPMRAEGGSGRRMAHGRRERPLPGRVEELAPDRIVVLRRGGGERPRSLPLGPTAAAEALAAGTYMAGELRRYWAFAATLALGTGWGPVHPPVVPVARSMAGRLPAVEITLARRPRPETTRLLRDSAAADVGAAR